MEEKLSNNLKLILNLVSRDLDIVCVFQKDVILTCENVYFKFEMRKVHKMIWCPVGCLQLAVLRFQSQYWGCLLAYRYAMPAFYPMCRPMKHF